MNKMKVTTRINGNLITVAIPILLIASLFILAKSEAFASNISSLSIGITLDLLFTIPAIYFLLIRKKAIPKITVVPFFVMGMLIAFQIIPKEHQFILKWVKTWIFPIVELSVILFLVYKIQQIRIQYKAHTLQKPDFFTALQEASRAVIPGKVSTLLTMEIAVIYYGFIYWKRKKLSKNEFTYHKNSGTIALLIALIGIIGIETYVLHILLLKWNHIAAWIVSGASIYSGVQIFGFLKSITKRPISIENNTLLIRYGILSEVSIPIKDIVSIDITSKDIELDSTTRKLSPFGNLENHNIVITLQKEYILNGLYGSKKSFQTLVLFVDQKEDFKTMIENNPNFLNQHVEKSNRIQ